MKLVPLHRTINIPQPCETSLTLFLISSNVNLDSKIFFFFFCWRGIGRGCPYDCNTSTQITSQVAKPHQKCTSIWTPHQSSPIVNTTPLKHMRHRLIVLLSKAHAYIWLPSADIASIFWEEFKIHSSPRNLCRFTAIQQYYFICIFATYCQYHFLRFVVPCTEPTSLDVFSIQHMYHMHITHDTNICTKHTVECTPSKPIHKITSTIHKYIHPISPN